MTLPSSGAIRLSDVNTELQRNSNGRIKMSEVSVKQLARRLSGGFGMSNLRGKYRLNVTHVLTSDTVYNGDYGLYQTKDLSGWSPRVGSMSNYNVGGFTLRQFYADISQNKAAVAFGVHNISSYRLKVTWAHNAKSETVLTPWYNDRNGLTYFDFPANSALYHDILAGERNFNIVFI